MAKQAFTMAEVLITLGIIGVIAAMTLPTLINNARYKELETGLKRSYSIIGQALNMYQAETGERLKPGERNYWAEVKTVLMRYLKIARDCGQGNYDIEACIPNMESASGNSSKVYKNLTGTTTIALRNFDDGQFIMNDGSLVLIENASNSDPNQGAIFISVDVNGFLKNPNRLGQDLFMFQLDSKGTLLPMGADGTKYYSETDEYCSVTSTNSMNGAGCTYNALTDKDYFKNLPK